VDSTFWSSLLIALIPVVIIIAFLLVILRTRMGVGNFQGRRGKKAEIPDCRFSDVAGVSEAVGELGELAESLNGDSRFLMAGAVMPKGVLLIGEPGVGKTLLARAMAGEAHAEFFALSGSDFVETFVGVGAARVRRVFDRARKSERAIVFIDELDAVGRSRSAGPGNAGTDERERTLNQLLVEMDGFTRSQVLVIGATNRADVLDPALTRPGRFDRQIHVPLPDRVARQAILRLHCDRLTLSDSVDLEAIARRTAGMSGAGLAELANEAAMDAGRANRRTITAGDFESALARVIMGTERRSAMPTDRDRNVAAWHEAGHAVAALVIPDAADPVSVSIVPRGPAGGVTWMAGTDDQLFTRAEARASLVVLLAGRAGEERYLDGDCTQGAGSDLRAASDMARAMVVDFGMSAIGPAPTGRRVEGAVSDLVGQALDDARALIEEHGKVIDSVADALLERETLSVTELREITERFTSL
jgi:cell division protease FtsH